MRNPHRKLTPEQKALRKRFLYATLVTSVALAMIGGSWHVIELGANRMEEMRARATYDLSEMDKKLRAAGEDIIRHAKHEKGLVRSDYQLAEVESLLTHGQWAELERMVLIPAGEFTAGTDLKSADPQDKPAHTVYLPDYKIDKYPVTVAQYARFVAATGHRPPLDWENGRFPQDKLFHPVTMVGWYDARDYCAWAGKRLPTEYEWEKAARGTDGRRWPWGNHMDPQRLNTYYSVGSTTDVTAFPNGVSPYGVYDMAGNVFEWTASDFKPYPGSDAPSILFQVKVPVVRSAKDKAQGVADLELVEGIYYKVLRGGSWKSDPFSTSAYHRNYALAKNASDFFGFRCAADVEGEGKQ